MWKGEKDMSKWKIAEIILSAISTLIVAIKALFKFVGFLGKLRTKSTATS